jgi:DNA sulfur modification protein DndE
MKKSVLLVAVIAVMMILISSKPKPVKVFMAGDSTMADKPIPDNPERGWGMVLPSYFNDNVVIENHARNGRSTRSFIREGRWDALIERVSKGDFVIIQFGHNDEKIETDRGTSPDEYKENLKRFVNDVRTKGAYPILCTPIMRRKFDENGKFVDQHGAYPDKVRELAKEEDVPLIDMHRRSEAVIEKLGVEGSKRIFLHIAPGEYKSLPEGRNDDTHCSLEGAMTMAGLAVEGFKELGIKSLVKNLRPTDKITTTFTHPFNDNL